MLETLGRPTALDAEHSCWLPRHRKSAGTARRLLRDFLAGLAIAEPLLGVGQLLLSELVANAVEHARTPNGRLIWVRFELAPGQLRIEVHDASSQWPTVRPPGEDDESGRGLMLVQSLAAAWGCRPREGGVGKAVWCTVGPLAEATA